MQLNIICVADGKRVTQKTSKPATLSMQVMTEIEFATSTHYRISENDVHCLHSVNERPTTIIFIIGQYHC